MADFGMEIQLVELLTERANKINERMNESVMKKLMV